MSTTRQGVTGKKLDGPLPRKVAVTALAPVIVTVQLPVPEQPSPAQPEKREPADGVAARVTVCPVANDASQVLPQLMPAGVETTVPVPVPSFVTVSVGPSVNVAVTDFAASIVTSQGPVPVQAPDQPAKSELTAGTASRVTIVPSA